MEWRGDPADIIAAGDDYAEVIAELSSPPGGVLARLLDGLIPEWHSLAACKDFDTDLWFPTKGQRTQPALDICGHCPVRTECLDEALSDADLDHGIRGGATAPARKAMRKARGAAGEGVGS